LCRRASELLGGELRVESMLGSGSAFEIVLPWDSGSAPEAPWKGSKDVTGPSPGNSAEYVPRDTIKALVKVLAVHAGPIAEAMIERELSRRGVSSTTLRRTEFSEFVQVLAQQLPKPQSRTTFADEALKVLKWVRFVLAGAGCLESVYDEIRRKRPTGEIHRSLWGTFVHPLRFPEPRLIS
jgi:hypothetical protein